MTQSNPAIESVKTGVRTSPSQWLVMACALFFLAILLGNPNYRWSPARTSPYGADFVQEWVAGDMLIAGAADRLYDRTTFQSWQHDADRLGFEWPNEQYYPAVYPPHYYCLTAPLALLPYHCAAMLWLCAMITAYAVAAWLAMPPWNSTASYRSTLFWCIGLLLPAMFFGCVLGQKGSLWLLILSGTVYLLKHDKPWAAGCVAALLTCKPTLCVLLPLAMLLNGQWRFIAGFTLSAAAMIVASAFLIPTSLWSDYLQVVLGASQYQAQAGYRSGWSTSLLSLIQPLGVPKSVCLFVMAVGAAAILAATLLSRRALAPVKFAPQTSSPKPFAHEPHALIGQSVASQAESDAGLTGASALRLTRASALRLKARGDVLTDPDSLWLLLVGTALLSPHAYFYDLTWLLLPVAGWLESNPRRAIRNLGIVWLGMTLGQSFEYGPAMPALSLLMVLLIDRYQSVRISERTERTQSTIDRQVGPGDERGIVTG